MVDEIRDDITVTSPQLVNDPASPRPAPAAPGWRPVSCLRSTHPVVTPRHRSFDDPAILMFTSGTTGSGGWQLLAATMGPAP